MVINALSNYLDQTQIDQALSDYQATTTQANPTDFLSYLFQHQLITEDAFQMLQRQTGVQLKALDADELAKESAELESGNLVERYAFLGTVGEGAMGQIHLVQENDLQRKVALKTLHSDVLADQITLGRFLNEVQITAQLDHPNIVPIYSLEQTDEGLAYSMKLVDGKSLKDLIIETREQWKQDKSAVDEDHSLDTLLDIFLKICDAMHYAHTRGVIHRDLKPANMMIGAYNEVYVMDWGIARIMGKAKQIGEDKIEVGIPKQADKMDMELTQTGQILGTPRYMSPEQIKGKNNLLDGRSDLFALGAILFELLTLKPAFTAKTTTAVLKNILLGQYQSFTPAYPGLKVPPELKAIVEKALSVKRDMRYHTVAEMSDDIRRYQRGEAVQARPDTPLQKFQRWFNRNRQGVLIGGVVLMILSTSITLGIFYQQHLAMIQAHEHEQQLSQFIDQVAGRARTMDRYFLKLESLLEEYAAVTLEALKSEPDENTPYFISHYGTQPPLEHSDYYDGKISLDLGISVPVYNTPFEKIKKRVLQLSRLNTYQKDLILRSGGHSQITDEAEKRKLIAQKGMPVMWTTVVSVEENLAYWFPGQPLSLEKAKTYIPTNRPFYKLGAHKRGKHWGQPYVEINSGALIMPAVMALYDGDRFYGIAGFDMKPDYVIKNLLLIKEWPEIERFSLVNGQGNEVVAAQKTENTYQTHATDKAQPYPEPQVIARLKAQKSGYLEVGQNLYAFYPLNAIGWHYIIKLPQQSLFKKGESVSHDG